ncbi:MAG: AraC family transcriptional regulator [Saprospiraceae bacterium]|nr:AraC family transcriptional regulator [Saprospiraceae bacterium]
MENDYQFLEFEGIQIAAFIEARKQNEHSGYYPHNVLFYVQQGQLNIRLKNKLIIIPQGNFCIVRKFTELSYFKTWDEGEDCALIDAMVLQDDFIKSAIKELGYKAPKQAIGGPVVNLEQNPILLGLYRSLKLYLSENQVPDKHLMYLKTKEALLGIIQANPEHLALFYEFSKSVKAELKEFMTHHIISPLPLVELAKLSGRSLSTFNRDFRKIFNASPHSWILKHRLAKARELLLTTSQTASEVYLELGFKDLAHFSRTFKKEFGIPPSKISP